MSKSHAKTSTSFKYNGRFDYEDFYLTFYNTITSNGYLVIKEAFAQKEKGVEELELDWDFVREVDDYTRFEVTVKVLIDGLTDVVVKKGDREVATNKGDVLVRISGEVITDWQGRWERSPFLEKLRDFYERYLFKQTLEEYALEVYNDVFLFEGEIKAFFELPSLT